MYRLLTIDFAGLEFYAFAKTQKGTPPRIEPHYLKANLHFQKLNLCLRNQNFHLMRAKGNPYFTLICGDSTNFISVVLLT